MINLLNQDCLSAMRGIKDKEYDLAICDPEYGIGLGKMAFLKEVKATVKQKNGSRLLPKKKAHIQKDWDKEPPSGEYFEQLFRVSNHQIIFGIDYFDLKVGKGRIKWDKCVPEGVSFNRYETAFCSLIDYEMEVPLLWSGMCQAKSLSEPTTQQGNKKLNQKRIHPCEKPVLLYKFLLKRFAKPTDKILDTHAGSFSIGIACYDMGYNITAYEKDKGYFEDALNRFKLHTSQTRLAI